MDPVDNTTTVVITESSTTEIICEAVGYPPPTIVWSKTNGSFSDRVSVNNNAENGNRTSVSVKLTITNASREDTGVYTCSANNSIGSSNRNINVTVQCKYNYIFKIFV